jgi:hypothetical protein
VQTDPSAWTDRSVAELIGDVYRAAPAAERGRLLEQLLQPLGLLSLVAVADGVFARLRLGAGWPELRVRPEDTHCYGVHEVVALAEHVLQVSAQVAGRLVQIIAASPALAGSAAALMLTAWALRGADDAGEPRAHRAHWAHGGAVSPQQS